jgi:RNA polymerase sigma-70 factor (ECF subfamily)
MNISVLWKENADFVLKICLRLVKDEAAAKDVRQEVFLKIMNSKKSFKNKASVKTWLYSIAFRCCVDYFRKIKKQRYVKDGYFHKQDSCLNDSLSPVWQVNNISEMPCPLSQLFVELFFGEDWSYEEIAQVFGLSITSVRKRMQTGLKELRKII